MPNNESIIEVWDKQNQKYVKFDLKTLVGFGSYGVIKTTETWESKTKAGYVGSKDIYAISDTTGNIIFGPISGITSLDAFIHGYFVIYINYGKENGGSITLYRIINGELVKMAGGFVIYGYENIGHYPAIKLERKTDSPNKYYIYDLIKRKCVTPYCSDIQRKESYGTYCEITINTNKSIAPAIIHFDTTSMGVIISDIKVVYPNKEEESFIENVDVEKVIMPHVISRLNALYSSLSEEEAIFKLGGGKWVKLI